MFTEPEISPRQNNAAVGIFLMLSAWGLFAVVDSSAKWLVLASISTVQVVFMRYAVQFGCSLIGAAGPFSITRKMGQKTFFLLSFRAILLVICTFFNFIAIKYLPLTMTSAIMFSSPIIVAAISMVFLREFVDVWKLISIFLGFIGVLVVIRPFDAQFHWAALLCVHNAIAISVFSLITRQLSGVVTASTMQFFAGGFGTIVFLPLVLIYWESPTSLISWVLMFFMGVVAWAGHEVFARAHLFSSAATLMPFSYSNIIFMTLASYFIFGSEPDFWVFVGAFLVVFAGISIWWREGLPTSKAASE
ncbi:MAG: DMT family transporter [Rhodobacteraceae bacterium]|nr:DMT family transporter [Paracoccaceae bacterium]